MIYFIRMSDISIWPRFDYYTINFNISNVTIVQYLWAINARDIHEKVINFRANIRFPKMSREQISALTNSSCYCSMLDMHAIFYLFLFIYLFFAGSETHHWRELIIFTNMGSAMSVLYFYSMIIVSLFYSSTLFFACQSSNLAISFKCHVIFKEIKK